MNAVFRLGDSGPAVAQIIGLLKRIDLLGDAADIPDQTRVTASEPTYDERVELAVRAFQQQRGLTVDGVVGSADLPPPRRGALAARATAS